MLTHITPLLDTLLPEINSECSKIGHNPRGEQHITSDIVVSVLWQEVSDNVAYEINNTETYLYVSKKTHTSNIIASLL